MAKRMRVAVPRKRASPRPPVRTPKITYTPELLANGRYRFEETDEPVVSIASDFGVCENTFRGLAATERWVRYRPPPRDLSSAARLLAQAKDLKDVEPAARIEAPGAAFTSVEESTECRLPDSGDAAGDESTLPSLPDTIARLHRAVLEELAAVEAMRARLRREPQEPIDAERTARTISSLAETLQKLQRLQCAFPVNELSNDDDMPADIDEFRKDLGRRIREFVASRTGRGDAEGAATQTLDPVR